MTKQDVSMLEMIYEDTQKYQAENNCDIETKKSVKHVHLDKGLIQDKAIDIIRIRHLALKDQMQALEKRRSEVLLLINRYKQSEYINEDAAKNLRTKEFEYNKRIGMDSTVTHVLEAIKEKIKLINEKIELDKKKEKAYIRELFMVNEQYEKVFIDSHAIEYILDMLEKDKKNKN